MSLLIIPCIEQFQEKRFLGIKAIIFTFRVRLAYFACQKCVLNKIAESVPFASAFLKRWRFENVSQVRACVFKNARFY
jgi:hypothetical protein